MTPRRAVDRVPTPVMFSAWAGSVLSAIEAWLSRVRAPRWWHRSLRLRLALWYGMLLASVLLIFGVAVYVLTSSVIMQGNEAAVRAEARVAMADIRHDLGSAPPYWPAHLTLEGVYAHQEPEITVIVLDAAGNIHSASATSRPERIPLIAQSHPAIPPPGGEWYTTIVNGERTQVFAEPILAPADASGASPAIGTLLVGKSLLDSDMTLGFLHTLLLGGGLGAIVVALVGGWAIAARALRPLAEVAETARTVALASASGVRGSLSQRVRSPGGQDELAHLVDTFNSMLAELERATAVQRKFVDDASHELRAPLTTVQGNLDWVLAHEEQLAPEERRAMLADARAEAHRLTNLVNELLILARADAAADASAAGEQAGAIQPARALIDLDRVVLDLVRQARTRLAAEYSPLELAIARIEPVQIRGDQAAIRQLGVIVLDNAIKYTPAAGKHAAVTISLERRNRQAVLSVRDTGIGIATRDLEHIFDRFYRADPARDRQGTGLGLAIARAIVERHGGTIGATSQLGQGTTFTIRLPVS